MSQCKLIVNAMLPIILTAGNCYAGASEGLVAAPLAHSEGYFMFNAGAHANKPSCSTQGESWAVNLATVGGRGIQSTVLAAHAQGKRLYVEGKGVCDAWLDRETASFVIIID